MSLLTCSAFGQDKPPARQDKPVMVTLDIQVVIDAINLISNGSYPSATWNQVTQAIQALRQAKPVKNEKEKQDEKTETKVDSSKPAADSGK